MSTLKVTNLKGRSTYIDVNGSTRLDMTDANGLKLPTWGDDNRPSNPQTGYIGYNLDSQSISIKYSKEGISHPSILEGKILSHLQKTDFTMEEELFLNSWISFFRTTSNLGNEVLVEVIEHKPVASLDNNRYLTQGGWIIEPEKENKTLNLIQLIGKDLSLIHI